MSSKEHCHGCGKLWSEESPECVFNYHKKSDIESSIIEITSEQVRQLKRAVDIGRGDYNEAKRVQGWVYRILNGEDVSEELEDYD